MTFRVYIPARYGAARLPGKPLLEVEGRPLVQHVYERARDSGAEDVVVATDDERIATVVAAFGGRACMTSKDHASGTDRIAEAVRLCGEAEDAVIVNVQGDEPHMPAAVIRQVAALVAGGGCDIATVCEPLDEAQLFDPNVVKVVRGADDRALYFSRAPVPYSRDEFSDGGRRTRALSQYRRHVGIYGFNVRFLQRFVASPRAGIEILECLEQLRALHFGAVIVAPDAVAPCGTGVDTPDDLARARAT